MSERRGNTTTLNRWILFVSLAGMILAVHLWVQKARGFDQGCLGLIKPNFVAESGCREVGDLPASHLFGVSNAAWGYALYFALALIACAKVVVSPAAAKRWHWLSEALVTAALLYSVYLIYVMAVEVGRYCILCLGSTACVTVLFALHVALRRRGGFEPVAESERGAELGVTALTVFGAMGLLVAVLLFVNRLGTRPLDQGIERQDMQRLIGESLPLFIDSDRLAEMRACRFDRSAPLLDTAKVVAPTVPVLGRRGGVTVVTFYDPNCSVCREHFPEFMRLAERYKDSASFQAVPRALWDKSLPEIAALKLAESSDKYYELWRRMFAQERSEPMRMGEITALFKELGLPTENLAERIALAQRVAVEERDRFRAAGISSLPAIFIDGHRIAQANCSENCVAKLLSMELEMFGKSRAEH